MRRCTHPDDGRTSLHRSGRHRAGTVSIGQICPRQAPAGDRPPPFEVMFASACSLRPFPRSPCCPAVGNALRGRPPSFSLSAWTFDSSRRTFIDMQTSEQRPFQRAENQRHRSSVKKASLSQLFIKTVASRPYRLLLYCPQPGAIGEKECWIIANGQGDAALSPSPRPTLR